MYRPKYTSSFLICPNLNDSQTFKSSSCKKFFLQYVCYWCNLLRRMFFVPCDNWKTLFFLKVCRYYEIFSTAISSFWKTSVFYIIFTVTVLMLSPKIKLPYTYLCIFISLFFDSSTLFFINEIFLRNSKYPWKHVFTKYYRILFNVSFLRWAFI